jgi:hypothetical protein
MIRLQVGFHRMKMDTILFMIQLTERLTEDKYHGSHEQVLFSFLTGNAKASWMDFIGISFLSDDFKEQLMNIIEQRFRRII